MIMFSLKSRLSGLIGRSDANDDDDSGSTARHEQPNVKSTSSDSGIGGEHLERGLVSRSHSMRYRVVSKSFHMFWQNITF